MKELKLEGGRVALVDDEDYDRLATINWHVTTSGYVKGYIRKTPERPAYKVMLHRYIMGLENDDPREVDHEKGNRLDNRRSKLRICTHPQNCQNTRISARNTSDYKGGTLDKRRNRWHPRIRLGKQQISLGYHDTAETAYAAYCEAAKKHFGEFARI